jgi:hypothetical protein
MPKPCWIVPALLTLTTSASASIAVHGMRLVDIDGRVHRLGAGDAPVALVFLDTGCPIANRYAPDLGALASVAGEAGVEFYGVLSDPDLSAADARKHRDEYELPFPVLFDVSGDLAARLAPTHVPEAFVLSADGPLYRGRVDDRFESVGVMRQEVTSHDLRDALHAAGAGEAPETERTEPVGCVFEAWDAAPEDGTVTYHRDVAPILAANCLDCHRTGDVGPFALDTYDGAQRRAKMISLVCKERRMPPWFAETGPGFRDERKLTDRQIKVLKQWAEAGAPQGDPADALPAPEVSEVRWRMGEPDLLVEMPVPYEIPAAGDDIYRYFVIPSELTEDKAIVAMDFRPGNPAVVHHCIAYMDRSGVARRIDEKSEAPGFSVFGETYDAQGEWFEPNGLDTTSQIAGWAPGTQPYRLPPGVGQHLGAGGDFVLEVHYHLNGKATTDQSALALYFADEPVERYSVGMVIGTENIDIPPGEPDYWRHAWMEVPVDVELIDVSPHMHYLGKSAEVSASLPDGSDKELIRINDWDFRWQGAYTYRAPVQLPAGSRIDAFFRFDNSAANPHNPSVPPIRVTEGWRTTDEMCLFYFTVVPRNPDETGRLYEAMAASFMRSGAPE